MAGFQQPKSAYAWTSCSDLFSGIRSSPVLSSSDPRSEEVLKEMRRLTHALDSA